jgi:hypothetical protein
VHGKGCFAPSHRTEGLRGRGHVLLLARAERSSGTGTGTGTGRQRSPPPPVAAQARPQTKANAIRVCSIVTSTPLSPRRPARFGAALGCATSGALLAPASPAPLDASLPPLAPPAAGTEAAAPTAAAEGTVGDIRLAGPTLPRARWAVGGLETPRGAGPAPPPSVAATAAGAAVAAATVALGWLALLARRGCLEEVGAATRRGGWARRAASHSWHSRAEGHHG